jgi:predicted nucleotidyltransferase
LEAFGSIRRDDFDAGRSDVDVLVEFEAQAADSFL